MGLIDAIAFLAIISFLGTMINLMDIRELKEALNNKKDKESWVIAQEKYDEEREAQAANPETVKIAKEAVKEAKSERFDGKYLHD